MWRAGAYAARLSATTTLAAPELIDLEVLSVLRRRLGAGVLTEERAAHAVTDLVALPMTRAAHRQMLPRCFELWDNLSSYDASYVALAEALSCTLLTADAQLARSAGHTCSIELLA